MSQDFRGDFLGFTYNGIHSSELGIVRVNTGDRGEKTLSPNIKDSTVEIPGSDGIYFLSTQYQQNQFSINFAFDSVSEEDIRSMRLLFADKQIHDLIFDEEPYKAYSAKVASPVKISYICFDSADGTSRIYKGEGSVLLTAFYPFARAPYQTWTEYVVSTVEGRHYDVNGVCIEEWVDASGLAESLSGYNIFSGNTATLYNPGELVSPLSMVINVVTSDVVQISYQLSGDTKGKMVIDTSSLTVDGYYRLNSKLRLIEGGTYVGGVFTPNGVIHNDAIVAGDFFKIEPATDGQQLLLSATGIINVTNIQYDYLYL